MVRPGRASDHFAFQFGSIIDLFIKVQPERISCLLSKSKEQWSINLQDLSYWENLAYPFFWSAIAALTSRSLRFHLKE